MGSWTKLQLGICTLLVLLKSAQSRTVNNTAALLNRDIDSNSSASTIHDVIRYDSVRRELTLEERLDREKLTWHWYPYKRASYVITEAGFVVENLCDRELAINDFPHGLFTDEQRLNGAIAFHFAVAFYFFIVLAMICSEYFLPSVECICLALAIPTDVAAATFMALATTIPEFFTNTISTFVTDSDMGIGTIIGSMLFNTLGVSACAALAAPGIVQLDWWPISRDSVLLLINLVMLTTIVWDGRVEWYESCIQVGALIFYFAVMFQNARLQRFFEKYLASWCCCCRSVITDSEASQINQESPQKPVILIEDEVSLWRAPAGSATSVAWWIFTWPIRLLLTLTIPNCKTYPKLFPLTFLMCMILLAVTSYMIFWMMVIIGHTFSIPEAVMGMTFLAAGGCLPEVASAVLMIRTGSGALGVSNSLGANSLAIMFSLGLPWFLRIAIDGGPVGGAHFTIESYGVEFIVLGLILAVVVLYVVITVGKYLLQFSIGVILALIYVIFVTFAILMEMGVFFASGHHC